MKDSNMFRTWPDLLQTAVSPLAEPSSRKRFRLPLTLGFTTVLGVTCPSANAAHLLYQWSGLIELTEVSSDPWGLSHSLPFDLTVFVDESAGDNAASSVEIASFLPSLVSFSIPGIDVVPSTTGFPPSIDFRENAPGGVDEISVFFSATFLGHVVDFWAVARLPDVVFSFTRLEESPPRYGYSWTEEGAGTIAFQPYRLQTTSGVRFPVVEQPGDYTSDSVVDGADFLRWQREVGTELLTADGSADERIDGSDLVVWQRFFGSSSATPVVSVPEPKSAASALIGIGSMVYLSLRRRRTSRAGCDDRSFNHAAAFRV